MNRLFILKNALIIILVSIVLLISINISASHSYADDDVERSGMSYKEIIKNFENNSCSVDDSIKIKEIPLEQANKMVTLPKSNMYTFNVDKAYSIKQKIGDNMEEETVYADVLITPKTSVLSSVTETKTGRVNISCTLGYERLTRNNISYVKGTYVGGKVISQQNGIQVTSLSVVYHDVGVYITSSGESGIAPDYKKTFALDVAKKNTFQKKNLSRNRYFDTHAVVGSVDGKFVAKYKANGYNTVYTIYVNASAS